MEETERREVLEAARPPMVIKRDWYFTESEDEEEENGALEGVKHPVLCVIT